MRLTPYGVCAVAGVLSAMALGGRAAREAGVDPEHAWDAGLFAILSCFIASRLLLVLSDPVAFARFPLLVLSLPSLTIGGLGLAAIMTILYLRRKRLRLVKLLDIFAAPGAILGAFLELGHWLDGTDVGMPRFAGHSKALIGFVPVSRYGVLASLALAALLWAYARKPTRPGQVAALGLMSGGVAAFILDMFSLPANRLDRFWLEPGQLVSLGATLAGAVLWTLARGSRQAEAPPAVVARESVTGGFAQRSSTPEATGVAMHGEVR